MKTPDIESYFSQSPLIAILRGITPDEIIEFATVIVDAGWRCIEVPLNSPSPLESVKLLADHFGDSILSGAGTVLTPAQARAVAEAGGRLIVAPNTSPSVIAEALKHGAAVMPGFMTATEAFQAYDAGARWLKLFPADSAGTAYIRALRTVLPSDAKVIPVGGVTPVNVMAFREAGGAAFGVGSQLYKPGMAVSDVKVRAESFMSNCNYR